jgi:hypothetical protein
MIFRKNIQFTKLIKVNGRAREFNFRKKQLSGEAIYDIDVSDERGERHYISLRQQNGSWAIEGNNVPAWLQNVYTDIVKEIDDPENEKNN